MDKKNIYDRIASGTVLVVLGTALSSGSAFATRIIAANYLGPDKYGTITLGITFITILTVVGILGLESGIVQRLPRTDNKKSIFIKSLSTSLGIGIIAAVLLFVSAPLVSSVIVSPQLGSVLRLFSLALPIMIFIRMGSAGLRGIEDVRGKVFGQNIGYRLVLLCLVSVGVVFSASVLQVAISWVISLLLAAIIVLYFIQNSELGFERSPRIKFIQSDNNIESTYSLLIFSLPLMLSDGIWMLMENTDNILIGVFLGGSGVGIYDAAFTVSRLFLIVTGAIGVLFVPIFSDLHEQNDTQQMKKLYRLTTKWTGLVAVLPFTIILFMSDNIIRLLFSPKYLDGSFVLVVISTGIFLHSVTGINGGAMVAVGDSRNVLIGNIFAYISNVVLNIILIPELGILGAAVSSAVSFTVLNIHRVYILHRDIGLFPLFREYTTAIILSFTLMSIVLYLLADPFGWLAVGAAIVVYIPTIVIFGINKDDEEFLRRKVSRIM